MPNNFWGHQEAFHGDAYAGFGAIYVGNEGQYFGNEYIRTKLILSLVPCVQYKFSMYLSLANYSTVGHEKLGVLFTEFDDFYNSQEAIEVTPNFVNSSGFLIDTSSWMRVDMIYTAKGTEQYLTIGYFSKTMDNDTVLIQDPSLGFHSYYYIDSVSLIEVTDNLDNSCCETTMNIPNVITPNLDGLNDQIDFSEQINCIEYIEIINRWGNICFVLNQLNPIWYGVNFPDGVYFYKVKLRNTPNLITGFIHLIR